MSDVARWVLVPPYTEAGDDPDGMDDIVILRGFNGPKVTERVEVVAAEEFEAAVERLEQIAAFEVDPDDGWDYSVGVMRAMAADALDRLGAGK